MTETNKNIITISISSIALILSLFNLWYSVIKYKLDISVGKQAKLFVGKLDSNKIQPRIFMTIALTNSGAKTILLNDIKLKVKLISNNKVFIEQEFSTIREYDNILNNDGQIYSELSPIVIISKSSIVKKYIFHPTKEISQSQIPTNFDLDITVLTKNEKNWKIQKKYEIKNIDNVWQDIEQNGKIYKSYLKEIYEK
ncbi:hypothetical protein [Tenacibaculum piscium]|uniref:hypothetical protein n=1 Tax=Tenacibaculum piscium TaxID=1458515 RepID=UPI001F37F6B7|nr:hypothetical protein [Tenacibaculum piscium]